MHHLAAVLGNLPEISAFGDHHGGAGTADILGTAACALGRQTDGRGGSLDRLPGGEEGDLKDIGGSFHREHAAGGQMPLPGDPKAAFSCPTADPLLQFGAIRLGRGEVVLRFGGEGLLPQGQIVCIGHVVGRLLRGEAIVLPDEVGIFAHGGEQIGGDLNHKAMGFGKGHHLGKLPGVVGGQGAVELDGDPCLLQKPDGTAHLGKALGIAAEPGVGLVGRAVKAEIDPDGRTVLQPGYGFFVNQRAVGVEGDEKTHLVQSLQDLPKLRVQEGLATGE